MHDSRAQSGPFYHPAKYTLTAVFVAAVLWGLQKSGGYDADVGPQTHVLFLGAAVLALLPVVESYTIAAHHNRATRFDGVLADIVNGMAILVLFRVNGLPENDAFHLQVAWIVIGTVLLSGVFQRARRTPLSGIMRDIYHDDAVLSPGHIRFLRAWPLVCMAIWILLAIFQPDGGWSQVQQLVFLLLFPVLFMRLRPRPGLGLANPLSIHVIGLAFLACAVFSVSVFGVSG